MIRRMAGLSVLVMAVTLAACGDSTGPGGSGSGVVQVFAKDNPNTMSAARENPALMFDRAGSSDASAYNGSLSGQMSVAIQTEAGTWVDIGSPASMTLTAHSSDSTQVSSSASVPVGTYTKVRIVWRNASAHLLAGSVFGGLTLTVDATVSIGGPDSVVIEKTVTPFTVEANANAHTEVAFDLNSELWLTEQNVESHTCSDTSVEAAVTAAARVTGS